MTKKRGSGWHNESYRHSLARRGVKTTNPNRRFQFKELDAKDNEVIRFYGSYEDAQKKAKKLGRKVRVPMFESGYNLTFDAKGTTWRKENRQLNFPTISFHTSDKKNIWVVKDDWDEDRPYKFGGVDSRGYIKGKRFKTKEDAIKFRDEYMELHAKGTKPKTHLLSDSEFQERFGKDVGEGEFLYATTRITPDGETNIYVRDSGDPERNNKLLRHEQEELRLFHELTAHGVPKNVADELAHNMNPVKMKGVMETYPLDPNN